MVFKSWETKFGAAVFHTGLKFQLLRPLPQRTITAVTPFTSDLATPPRKGPVPLEYVR